MKIVAIVVAGLLAAAALVYYHGFYPPNYLRRVTIAKLDAFGHTVETQDRAAIVGALNTLLADDAKIVLEISLFSIFKQDDKPVPMPFAKPDFLAFMDNTLSRLSDYHLTPQLESFALSRDHQTASVVFSSRQWADGSSFYADAAVGMHYSSAASCKVQLRFVNEAPSITDISCYVEIRSVPKPGQEGAMRSPEALQQLLKEQR